MTTASTVPVRTAASRRADLDGRSDEELVALACGGGPDARAARGLLTGRYQALVHAVANRQRSGTSHDLDDLTQVANVGLQKAVRDFDATRGVHFAAYASAKVRGEVLQWFRDGRYAVHVPRPLHETFMRVRGTQARLRGVLGREPTVEEVGASVALPPSEVLDALALNSAQRSQVAPLPPDRASRHDPLVGVAVLDALERMPERPRRLLYLRYWLGWPQQSVADDLGVSQGHVSRLERRALADLGEALG